jgi:hypothetical protein
MVMAGTGCIWLVVGAFMNDKEKVFFVRQTLPLPLNKSLYEDGQKYGHWFCVVGYPDVSLFLVY